MHLLINKGMQSIKNKTGFLFFTLMVLSVIGMAQSIRRTVISSGGNYSSNASGALYANVGELQINTFSSVNNYLTEGFVQPFVQFPVIVPSHTLPSESVVIFPNPSSDIIYVSASENKEIELEIYDIQGRLLIKNESIKLTKNTPYSLSILELNSGVYFIKTYTTDGNNNTFRFVKL